MAEFRKDKQGKWVQIKHNWKLRGERAQNDIVSDVGTHRIKPTAHKQRCEVCGKKFKKGEGQIKIPVGMFVMEKYGNQWGTQKRTIVAHSTKGGQMNAKMQYAWMHVGCWACEAAKLSRNLDDKRLAPPICETCSNKFNCLTGNKKEEPTPIDPECKWKYSDEYHYE